MPRASVVTPWRSLASLVGLLRSIRSEWECMSMKPGQIIRSAASITRPAATAEVSPRSTEMVSPSIPTLPRNQVCPVPSIILPRSINKSNIGFPPIWP